MNDCQELRSHSLDNWTAEMTGFGATVGVRGRHARWLNSTGSRHPPGDNCKQIALQRGRGPESLPSIC